MSSGQATALQAPTHPSKSSAFTFRSLSPNAILTSLPGVKRSSKNAEMPNMDKVATDKSKTKSTDHASPDRSSIRGRAGTERESGKDAGDDTSGVAESNSGTSGGSAVNTSAPSGEMES